MDWQNIVETCAIVTIVALFVERALSLAFEHKFLLHRLSGYKEIIAYGVSLIVCFFWEIDAISSIMTTEKQEIGYFITAGVIAGGAKASVHLFQDVMGVRNSAVNQSTLNKSVKE